MDYDKMTVKELEAALEECDQQRLKAKEKGRELMAARHRRIVRDHAAEHGLTVDEYEAAKAANDGRPLVERLKEARKSAAVLRQLQVATPGAVSIGSKVEGVK